MYERTTQERWEKFILHRDTIIQEANLKGAEIPLNADYPEIIIGLQRITLGLPEAEVESLLDDILGEVVVGDYSTKGQAILDEKEAIRQAIIAKDVAVPVETPLSQYPAKIASIETGGGGGTPKHLVKFVLPDGYVFSIQEVVEGGSAVNPGIPHEIPFTTFTGWLGDYTNITKYTVIFARYEPISSDIILCVNITASSLSLTILKSSYGTVTIDWGDGITEVLSTLQHTYSEAGEYIIRISGSNIVLQSNQSNRSIFDSQTESNKLRWAVLGSSLSTIGPGMFNSLVGLQYVIFPALTGPHYLRSATDAFSYCLGLKCIVFPDSQSYMASENMLSSTSVRYIYLPRTVNMYTVSNSILSADSAEYIDYGEQSNLIKGLLGGCKSFEIATYEALGSEFNDNALREVKIRSLVWNEANRTIGVRALTLAQRVVQIPEYIETIKEYAFIFSTFERCILNDTTLVHPSAFYTCTKLTRIKFKKLTTNVIPTQVLNDCRSLAVIDFPSSVTEFSGALSFGGGRGCLSAFICRATTPPTAAASLFEYTLGVPDFYVPDESVDAYKAATNWTSVAHRIYPLSDCPERYLNDDL